jgi:hypothetical protein
MMPREPALRFGHNSTPNSSSLSNRKPTVTEHPHACFGQDVSAGVGGFERLLQQELCEPFGGLVEAEAFAGPVVELVGDAVEVELAVHGEVGALGEVLA